MAFVLTYEDINGAIHTAGLQGQQEELHDDLICWIPHADDLPALAHLLTPEWGVQNEAEWRRLLSDIYSMNFRYLFEFHQTAHGNAERCRIMAYLRMALFRAGLVKPGVAAGNKHCRYTLVQSHHMRREWHTCDAASRTAVVAAFEARLGNQAENTLVTWLACFGGNGGARGTAVGHNALQLTLAAHGGWTIDRAVAKRLRSQLSDLVCVVAYMFRARGHHYAEGYDETYNRIWKGTVFSEQQDDCGIPWSLLARDVMKVIFPVDLDAYWTRCSDEGSCSGNLVIRHDCAPAGCASIVAIRRGVDDLLMAFPQLHEPFNAQIHHLEHIEGLIGASRWAGSINSRYYGEEKARYDEARLASLAATILAALDSFSRNAPLLKSAALKRVAQSAPITGAILTRILTSVADSPAMISGYLPAAAQNAEQAVVHGGD